MAHIMCFSFLTQVNRTALTRVRLLHKGIFVFCSRDAQVKIQGDLHAFKFVAYASPFPLLKEKHCIWR